MADYFTVDELLRDRLDDPIEGPALGYPKSRLGIDDLEYFTGRDLNRMIDFVASQLIREGFPPVLHDAVIGIVSNSDLDFIINVFALGRLGYTSFIISPRLDNSATLELLQDLKSQGLVFGPSFVEKAEWIKSNSSIKTTSVVEVQGWRTADLSALTPVRREYDGPTEKKKIYIIMHSSGSTGKPKTIIYPHWRLLHVMVNAHDLSAFIGVPVFHAYGFVCFLQALYKRKTVWLFNGNIAQTHDSVKAVIKAADPEIVWTTPYILKLLAEKQDGIDVLKRCKVVSFGGSRCPDELGDYITSQGIHFGTNFAATEVAFVFTNLRRPREDKFWDYMSAPPHVEPYVYMKPVGENVFELVVLDGHKGKVMTNSNDPPNSFHTKDLFIPHPTLPKRWKYVGRLDDRITLSNGEKFIPLDIEGRVRGHPLIKEAVVFGVDRPLPGLLLFRSEAAEGLSDDELLDQLWPTISEANSRVSAFGQIGRDYVAILPASTDCPTTDKLSIKRMQVYRQFASLIDDVYEGRAIKSKNLKLSVPELEDWIVETMAAKLEVTLPDKDIDFFAAGVDSQKAIQMERFIIQNLDVGDSASKIGSLVVFKYGNVKRLAQFLYDLRMDGTTSELDDVDIMKAMIEKYSKYEPFVPSEASAVDQKTVLLTGATGSLGSAILYELLSHSSVQIFCPVRANSDSEAKTRLQSLLKSRGYLDAELPANVHGFACDIGSSPLQLPADVAEVLQTNLTHVIHAAWPVNFSPALQSFEPHVAVVRDLYNLTLQVKSSKPAELFFCSSVGTAMASTPEQSLIRDGPISDLKQATATGYAQSKLVVERILEAAYNVNNNVKILRIGQIVPPTTEGKTKLWNQFEMIPLVISSARAIHALPAIPGPRAKDACTWVPANILAQIILDLGSIAYQGSTTARLSSSTDGTESTNGSKKDSIDSTEQPSKTKLFYNIVSPQSFSWSQDFLPQLQANGLEFEILPFPEWLDKLTKSELDPFKNPSIKLVDIFRPEPGTLSIGGESKTLSESTTMATTPTTTTTTTTQPHGIVFETVAAQSDSQVFRDADWKKCCSPTYVADLLKAWESA